MFKNHSDNIDFGSYKYYIRDNFLDLSKIMSSMNIKGIKICIVSDSNVSKLYTDEVKKVLNESFDLYDFSFEAGESYKNLSTVQSLYGFLIENHFNRDDILIALGGGVVGDLCGFCASTYLRGIRYIQMPTSLLASVDSSIGGKTGVDFEGYKNMVGAFYEPLFVYVNTIVLKTLPEGEFKSGLGEVLKYAFILDRDFFEYLNENLINIYNHKPKTINTIIYNCAIFKKMIVEEDPKEKGIRVFLNFGHTIGHAIEKLSNFTKKHGECVAIGSFFAIDISREMGYLNENEAKRMQQLIMDYGFDIDIPDSISTDDIIKAISSDKKQGKDGLRFIILDNIGHAKIISNMDKKYIIRGIENGKETNRRTDTQI